MADRRMLSKVITSSDEFLDMPATSQVLYFHLVLNADDDGFIANSKTIMRMIGAHDDDMKMLIAKQYVLTFEESKVIVIRDWKLQNSIRKDRKKPTFYQQEKAKLSEQNGSYYKVENADISGSATTGQPDDNQVTTKCQHRLGKVRLGKVSIEKKSQQKTVHQKSKIYDDSSDYMKLSKLLLKEIRNNDPKYKEPNLQKWADDFRKLVEIDKRPVEQVIKVIKFAQSNEFWKSNILSAYKVRKQYSTLIMQANESNHPKPRYGHTPKKEELPSWAKPEDELTPEEKAKREKEKNKKPDTKRKKELEDKLKRIRNGEFNHE